VVGARSVVLRDIPPWTVAAGNPCKLIKPREVRRGGDSG
jgi:acetyltransferase-like isoleucine patch superfamily enzyme